MLYRLIYNLNQSFKTILNAVVVLDRNSDIKGTIDWLKKEMEAQGMEVYYRDWIGIIQGYSPVYKSQVGSKLDYKRVQYMP